MTGVGMRVNGGGAAQPEINKNKTTKPLFRERTFGNNREMIVNLAFIIEKLCSLETFVVAHYFTMFDIQ
jgi:hypothetical protein